MDFHLTREQEMLRKMYREFAENEVKPLAEELDEEERFPMETVEKMGKLGMMGIYFPKEYGGAGGDVLSYAMCVEELAKVCGTTGVIVSAHTSLCCAPIYEHGTEEQKMKYLPDLLLRQEDRRLRPDRAQRRHRRLRPADHRRAGGGRPLRPQRLQVLHHQRHRGQHLRGLRHDRPPRPATTASPPSSWRAPSPASPWASTRRRWASAAPPPAT